MKTEIKRLLREALIGEKMMLKDYTLYTELVANAYLNAKDYDSSVIKHWNSLNQSNHSLFKRLLSKVNVVFTTNNTPPKNGIVIDGRTFKVITIKPEDEYQTQSEMKNSFNNTGILKISIDHSSHPVFSVIDNIVFRTVHDYIAHILGNHDFGAKGELACYNLHAKMAPNDATPALFTEVVGQAATTLVIGDFPKQKIVVLDGFDFINVGVVDDNNYEIVNKVLVKKGEVDNGNLNNRTSRTEPKAIHKDLINKEKLEPELAENKIIKK